MAGVGSNTEFEDFDDESVYNDYEAAILNLDTRNVVIDFNSDNARAVRNVDHCFMKEEVLEKKRVDDGRTKWISIWGPWKQKEIIEVLRDRYGFSSRLFGLMCSAPDKPQHSAVVAGPNSSRLHKMLHSPRTESFKSKDSESNDAEKRSDISEPDPGVIDLNHYRLINNVWHFFSVDFGQKFLCIGYNSVYNPKTPKAPLDNLLDPDEQAYATDRPDGVRLWTWLILCYDDTVISIHENPSQESLDSLNVQDKDEALKNMKALKYTRGNFLNAFRQLSKINDSSVKTNPIMKLSIRLGSQTPQSSVTPASDAPGLLFYYLFDDWYASYSLVAREEHQYGAKLEDVRTQMFQKPDVRRIQRLHRIGRQLAVLQRMYESYAMIIDRILDKQGPVASLLSPSEDQSPQGVSSPPAFRLHLSQTTIGRFDRLRDRVNHFALSEIKDCLNERESLVFLNFNLITLKQSQAVERLTRITILLAKITILFMPVSLITAIFSTNVKGLEDAYSGRTYWVTFGIVMFLSFVFLVIFGKLSGTVEGRPIYRSLTETFYHRLVLRRRQRSGA